MKYGMRKPSAIKSLRQEQQEKQKERLKRL